MPRDRKRSHHAVTSRPQTPAPQLPCPSCTSTLRYRETTYGGRQPAERWDRYECDACGPFEYRHRTNRLRSLNGVS
jgi:hypothetical protein